MKHGFPRIFFLCSIAHFVLTTAMAYCKICVSFCLFIYLFFKKIHINILDCNKVYFFKKKIDVLPEFDLSSSMERV